LELTIVRIELGTRHSGRQVRLDQIARRDLRNRPLRTMLLNHLVSSSDLEGLALFNLDGLGWLG
jgi:hypothetical protein